ncbi:MAG: hypothetical protein K9N46_10090 [Candidatus Marinimicrobia bacterium]|nr:hypothetical protein [Candidatus Neomarinimicrobiota bacterium]MCF7829273.1 hypothetical protein [Candidatus Neomarinimicrobiota bacterium]MCF7881074.1 hypothetical protein [Candidatus Neomarinimicrobiota bacterium]
MSESKPLSRRLFFLIHGVLLLGLGAGIYTYDLRWGVVFTLWSLGTALGDDIQDTIMFRSEAWLTRMLKRRGIRLEMRIPPGIGPEPFRSWIDWIAITFGDAWHVAKFTKHTLWFSAAVVALDPGFWTGIVLVILGHVIFGLTHEIFFGKIWSGKDYAQRKNVNAD